jgi:hypothetical protein
MDRPQTFEEWLMSIHPPKCPDCHSQSCLCSGKEFVVEFTQEELDEISRDAAWLPRRCQGCEQKTCSCKSK